LKTSSRLKKVPFSKYIYEYVVDSQLSVVMKRKKVKNITKQQIIHKSIHARVDISFLN
jgi:hypothetical protein